MQHKKERSSSASRRSSIAAKWRHGVVSMVFAVLCMLFIWRCHGIPILLKNWKKSLAPQFRSCRTGLQGNTCFFMSICAFATAKCQFCIKKLFFFGARALKRWVEWCWMGLQCNGGFDINQVLIVDPVLLIGDLSEAEAFFFSGL